MSEENVTPQNCNYKITRLDGFKYIRPLMFVETDCEAPLYTSLKNQIAEKIEQFKQANQIISASVYFRDLKNAEWISCNDTEKYFPGSLLKVSVLLAYLHMEEQHPGTLDKKLMLTSAINEEKNPVFISKSISLGKSYSIRELLHYMISYSDNNASYLLAQNIDQSVFTKTFTDLGLPTPNMNALNYPVTAREYSYFMRTLYNSSYLSMWHSEYAAELLSTSDFKEGFSRSIPANVKLIHKFGEAGDPNLHQLHESGIFYLQNKPYLLTVMTKGKDLDKLPEVISAISALVYQNVSAN